MTRDEKKRVDAAIRAFTGDGEHSSGFLRNDVRDLMVGLMTTCAERNMDVPKLVDAALKIYAETYRHNV